MLVWMWREMGGPRFGRARLECVLWALSASQVLARARTHTYTREFRCHGLMEVGLLQIGSSDTITMYQKPFHNTIPSLPPSASLTVAVGPTLTALTVISPVLP